MDISYDYYKIFYYVAKHKSFSQAAHALNNNQPNITRMIKNLENQLGCTLFIRQRHGVTLTPEGEKLYAHVKIAFDHILAGEEEITLDRSLHSGKITIAASEIALHCVLLPILKQFRNTYPGVRIHILNCSTPEAVQALKNGLADLAIVTTTLGVTTGLHISSLRSIQEVAVCSNAFSLSDKEILSWQSFEKYPLISLGEQTNSFLFYSQFFTDMGLTFRPDIEASTADQILPMIKSDLGIGFIPIDFLEKETDCDNLVIIKTLPTIPPRDICLLTRKSMTLSIAANTLKQMLINNFNEK